MAKLSSIWSGRATKYKPGGSSSSSASLTPPPTTRDDSPLRCFDLRMLGFKLPPLAWATTRAAECPPPMVFSTLFALTGQLTCTQDAQRKPCCR